MISEKVKEFADKQKANAEHLAGEVARCPRCGRYMRSRLYENALSRRADVYICSGCGNDEAFEDYLLRRKPTEKDNEDFLLSWWLAEQTLENGKCADCIYLMFSEGSGECSKGYKGIILPEDGCCRGKKKKVKNT